MSSQKAHGAAQKARSTSRSREIFHRANAVGVANLLHNLPRQALPLARTRRYQNGEIAPFGKQSLGYDRVLPGPYIDADPRLPGWITMYSPTIPIPPNRFRTSCSPCFRYGASASSRADRPT